MAKKKSVAKATRRIAKKDPGATKGAAGSKKGSAYEVSVRDMLAANKAVVLVESRCGEAGLRKARELKLHVELEFGDARDSGVTCLVNPSFAATAPGSFRVTVGAATAFDCRAMARPYRAMLDLTMEELVGSVFARVDACDRI